MPAAPAQSTESDASEPDSHYGGANFRLNCLTGRRVGSPDHLFQMSPHCGVGEKTLFTCAGRNAGHEMVGASVKEARYRITVAS